MLPIGIVLFLLAILFGGKLLYHVLKNRKTPKSTVILHGTAALLAIFMMAGYVVMGHKDTLLILSLVLFVFAALGGLTMLSFDIRKKKIPKIILFVHPLIGISAFIILIYYVTQQVSFAYA